MATKVSVGTMTSSPAPTLKPARAKWIALVPVLQAMACSVSQNRAKSCSNWEINFPEEEIQLVSRHSSTYFFSFPRKAGCATGMTRRDCIIGYPDLFVLGQAPQKQLHSRADRKRPRLLHPRSSTIQSKSLVLHSSRHPEKRHFSVVTIQARLTPGAICAPLPTRQSCSITAPKFMMAPSAIHCRR